MRIFLSFLVLSFAFIVNVNGQKTVVYGKITDAGTKAPIPYVNIVFKGTYIGTSSDLNGNFNLSSTTPTATIEITAIGYRSQTIPIKLKQSNKIDIALAEDIISLGMISVKPGENPAIPLFRKIINRKKENNTANFPSWQSKLYAKTEIDIKNVNRSLSKKKLLKQFNFVFKYIDSLEIQGKTFLPVFFTETVSNYSHNSVSNTNKEEIIASKVSGITTDMISQFTGKMYEGINVYDNYIMISDVGLISPLNSLGLQFYHYYLRDSAMVKGRKIYEISFKPKQALDPTFKGKFWVEDESFALTKVDMVLSTKANVNFLNNFQYSIEFQRAENRWVPLKEALIADLDIKKDKDSEMIGFMGRKTNIYQDFKFTELAAPVNAPKNLIVVDKNAMLKDENFWIKTRPIELQKREAGIYAMVDSIQHVPLYKTIAEYLYMFYYGYRDLGKIELGPYYSAYSTNKVEGTRFRIGGRTTMKFDQKWRLKGYGAYGSGDDNFKYGGGVEYFFSKKPRLMIAVSGSHDYQLMGLSSNALTRDNFLTSVLSKTPYSKLNMIDRVDVTFDKDWVRGWSNQLTFTSSAIKSGPFVPFIDPQGNLVSTIRTGEITFNTRFAPKETIVIKGFERSTFGIFNPVLNVSVTGGLKGFLGGDYPYLKLNANFADKIAVNPFGYITYYVQAGKIYGKVPWPLMKIHEGNESYAFDAYAFNLMNNQEFVSDAYVSLFLEHHLQGFFLNKMPLFQRLKWREVVGVRSLMGNYDEAQHTSLVFPAGMKGMKSTPYTEFSAGIENILKIIRVDAVWRYNYNQDRKIQLGLLFSLQLTL